MRIGRDIVCRELVKLASDYREGGLGSKTRSRYEEHVIACPGCATFVAQIEHTIHELGQLKRSPSSEESERLVTRLLEQAGQEH